MPRSGSNLRRCVFGVALVMVLGTALGTDGAHAAEYGTGPWVKGYTDIFGGIVPPQPGLYVRNDVYHYEGEVGTTVFNGRIALGVEEDYLADILALTYVTPWKILGGTYAVAVAPSIVQMGVGVAATLPGARITGPLGLRTFDIPSFTVTAIDHELAQGDTAFAPLVLGWNEGNFHWNFALFGFAPTGHYSTRRPCQYEPQSLGDHAEARRHLFQPQDRVAGERRRHLFGEFREPGHRLRHPAKSSISTAPSPRISVRSALAPWPTP